MSISQKCVVILAVLAASFRVRQHAGEVSGEEGAKPELPATISMISVGTGPPADMPGGTYMYYPAKHDDKVAGGEFLLYYTPKGRKPLLARVQRITFDVTKGSILPLLGGLYEVTSPPSSERLQLTLVATNLVPESARPVDGAVIVPPSAVARFEPKFANMHDVQLHVKSITRIQDTETASTAQLRAYYTIPTFKGGSFSRCVLMEDVKAGSVIPYGDFRLKVNKVVSIKTAGGVGQWIEIDPKFYTEEDAPAPPDRELKPCQVIN